MDFIKFMEVCHLATNYKPPDNDPEKLSIVDGQRYNNPLNSCLTTLFLIPTRSCSSHYVISAIDIHCPRGGRGYQ